MADSKISGLPASTTPLAGTEVLPIVQGGQTRQVSVANLTAGRAVSATTVSATTSVTTPVIQATSSAGGTLNNNGGTAQLQWGSGGGSNLSLEVATNINPANAAVAISPTGTGTVTINPATASTMNNVAIGGTTPLTGAFTTVKASTTVGVGAATPSTSGAGITFPATQSASTNANTLDDYEEGTWTPIVGGDATYNFQNGRYVKIGSVVTINCDISINVIGTGSTQFISGLPFAANNGTNAAPNAGPIGYFAGVNSSVVFISALLFSGNSFISFETLTAANSAANDAAAILKSGTRIIFSITYLTA